MKKNNKGITGLRVEVRNNNFNEAMRIFKKKVQEDGILQEYRKRQEYEKPTQRRKREKAAGRARWLKKLEKQNLSMQNQYKS